MAAGSPGRRLGTPSRGPARAQPNSPRRPATPCPLWAPRPAGRTPRPCPRRRVCAPGCCPRPRTTSYAELRRAAADIADRLVEAGLRLGEGVALIGETVPALACACFASSTAGGHVIPIYAAWPSERVSRALTTSGASGCLLRRRRGRPSTGTARPIDRPRRRDWCSG